MNAKLGLVETCSRAVLAADLSTCKPLGFDLLGWLAILTAIAGVAIFVIPRLWKPTVTASLKISRRPWRSRFRSLCASIKPFMDDNSRIFQEFGPNSGRGNGSPKLVRQDVSVWKELMHKVVANNAQIQGLIVANRAVIPSEFEPIFTDWTHHIAAFEAHAADDLVDYRNNQFPAEVVDIVHRHA